MPISKSLSKADLATLIGRSPDNSDMLPLLLQTMFAPRFIRTSDAALTLVDRLAGACIISTGASTLTVTLPTGLEPGFICTFLQLGAGSIAFSGTHVGGSTSAGQNTLCSAMCLDDGTWLVYGSVV